MKKTFSLILITVIFITYANGQNSLTAEDIVNKSIDFCGGVERISRIKSSNLLYDMTINDGSRGSVVEKRVLSQKYMQSVISTTHYGKSMHFNGTTFTVINGDETKTIKNNLDSIEEVKLLTYNQPQFGYKELSWTLKRLEDRKFNHFDCYVVRATSKDEYSTLNYFDKTNFRLIMIIYPKGNKSLLMEYVFKDSVLFDSKIHNVEIDSQETTLTLKKLDINININPLWFQVDSSLTTAVPDYIKKGTFISSNGTIVNRTDLKQTEGIKSDFNLSIKWHNNYTFEMVDSKSLSTQNREKAGDNILVQIVSWNKDEYVCHYYSKGVAGTQEYKVKK